MFVTATVAAVSNKKAVSWSTRLEASTVVVTMLLFERFYANALLLRAASKQTILVLTLWAFGAMLLGMIYSGNLISELAAPSVPAVPQDMHELSVIDYPIYSANAISDIRNGSWIWSGYLQYKLSEYLQKNSTGNSSLTKDVRRLYTALTWVKEYNRMPVGESEGSTNPHILFAIADRAYKARALGLRSVLTNSHLRALPGCNLPFFDHHGVISVKSNFLPVYGTGIATRIEYR